MKIKGNLWNLLMMAILVTGLLLGLWYILSDKNQNDGSINLSSWAVYWSLDEVGEEINQLEGHLGKLSLFAAYFDHQNRLMVDRKIQEFWKEQQGNLEKGGIESYLTIVNDKVNDDGTSSLKDSQLLYDLFCDEQKMDAHIGEIIQLALIYDVDGVELDYEGIKNDLELWDLYLEFIQRLEKQAQAAGLGLRIILEANTPIGKLNFPVGPEYMMMAYNLHGNHSGPGPKADRKFIKEILNKVEKLPGEGGIAFATGGFDWSVTGEVTALTEQKAKNIQQQYGSKVERDQESDCLFYRYLDGEGINHEVWYADQETLARWIELAKEVGIVNCSLWRLGGNNFS